MTHPLRRLALSDSRILHAKLVHTAFAVKAAMFRQRSALDDNDSGASVLCGI